MKIPCKIAELTAVTLAAVILNLSMAQAATTSVSQNPDQPGDSSTKAALNEIEEESTEDTFASRFTAAYFNLFYGPSISTPTSRFQPSPNGSIDRSRPVSLRNYFSLGYRFNDDVSLSGTASFHNEPVEGREFQIRDPFLRLSHNSIISSGPFNVYADIRTHFPITTESRERDLLAGFQSFQVISYDIDRWSFAVWGSERANYFGRFGEGNDLELYLGPNIAFQYSPKVAITLLYEMGASHRFGDKAFEFVSDGTDLQPGVSWDITPNLNVSPYLNLYTGERIALDNTSFGMTMYWKMF